MILIKHSESRVQLQMLCKWSLNVICKCLNSKRKLQLSQYFEFLVRAFFDHIDHVRVASFERGGICYLI